MAISRNLPVAEAKVLFNLENYSCFLLRDLDEESKLLENQIASFKILGGEESAFKDIVNNLKSSILECKQNIDKYMNLSNAVNAILKQEVISEEQQQLLIENVEIYFSDPDIKQFIASYLQNYTDAKKAEDNSNSQQVDTKAEEKVNAAASAFFANAKAKEEEEETKAQVKAIEDQAKAFFASAKGNKTNKPTPPARVYSGPSLIDKLFGKKGPYQGPSLNLNGDDKGPGNTKKR